MAGKLSKQVFKERANNVHNYFYRYDKVVYINNDTPVIITCPIHGDFKQTPKAHLNGEGCKLCALDKKRDNFKNKVEIFLNKAYKKFNDCYSFPFINDEYTGNKSKITIKCNKCQNTFIKTANDFLAKFKGLNGCSKCRKTEKKSVKKSAVHNCVKYKTLPIEVVKRRIHDKYGDSVTMIDLSYVNASTNAIFICNKCDNKFKRKPNTFFYGNINQPCPKCSKIDLAMKATKTTEDFIKKANEIYKNGEYSYEPTVYVKSDKPVKIHCNKCGNDFEIVAESFLQGHGCNKCNHSTSIMETMVEERLKEEGIKYETQKKIEGIRFTRPLPFDFYLPDYNIAIECQGKQHFQSVEYYGGDKMFETRKIIDEIKRKGCENKGIKLIYYSNFNFYFPYFVFTNLDKMMEFIKNYNK